MLYSLLICLASVSADPAPKVQVRFVYTARESKDSQVVDVWIKQKLQRVNHRVFALSDWHDLTAELRQVCQGNGMFIEAEIQKRKEDFKITAEGCAGFAITAKGAYQLGETKLYPVRGLRQTYMAVRTLTFVSAEQP